MGVNIGVNYCNKCLKDFTIEPKEKKYSRGIIETYFTCPHCNEKYTSFYTNAAIRKKQGELRHIYHLRAVKIRELAAKEDEEDTIVHEIEAYIDDVDENIQAIKEEIGIDMDKLKEKMVIR